MMNKINYLLLLLSVALLGLTSCSTKNAEQPSAHDLFVSELSAADTLQVMGLCEDFFKKLMLNDKDAAFEVVKSLDENNQVVSLSREQMAKLSTQFTIFPVMDFRLKDFKIGEETDNICSYSIVFSKDENGNEETINFGFCPVRVNGQWYITVRNASAELAQ